MREPRKTAHGPREGAKFQRRTYNLDEYVPGNGREIRAVLALPARAAKFTEV